MIICKKLALYFSLLFFLINIPIVFAHNRGLQNLGNTCYLNAFLQCLSRMDALNKYFKEHPGAFHEESIPAEYYNVVRQLNDPQSSTVLDPTEFMLKSVGTFFNGKLGLQQDSPEFLDKLIVAIFENNNYNNALFTQIKTFFSTFPIDSQEKVATFFINRFKENPLNVKENCVKLFKESNDFLGQDSLLTEIEKVFYSKNKTTWSKLLVFMTPLSNLFLLFPILFDGVSDDAGHQRGDNVIVPVIQLPLIKPDGTALTSLSQALDEYFIKEILEDTTDPNNINLRTHQPYDKDNRPYCVLCEKKVNAVKGFTINSLPKILILSLKRYSETYPGSNQYVKNNASIDCPLSISLYKYIHEPDPKQSHLLSRYTLKAISAHGGRTDGGHYWAWAQDGNKWYMYNDETISEAAFDEIKNHSASYVLFYQQETTEESPQSIEELPSKEQEDIKKQQEQGLEKTGPDSTKASLSELRTKINALKEKISILKKNLETLSKNLLAHIGQKLEDLKNALLLSK